ncbi:MAG: hypothetical protein CFH16_00986 [Alphaproteobacteria bacterium MarineAlpha5_Bin6]|nr:MAG: hypothetical protein CFH17_00790 [Alphaproteobacteria bacterium MarineAlpha5_Bin7]PPR53473.1 MAG: hypothetical protein CFH16_00986 [Alphaproteobacteria bacterium MarineAlpha5_Bin6]
MLNKLLSNNLFLLILLSAIWGSAFFAIKISVQHFHPISVASFRLIIGALLLFLFFSYKKYSFNFFKNNFVVIFTIGLIGNFIPFFLISWSEQYIKSNTAGLLLSVGPIFTLILSHFMTHDEKFSALKLISILIGFLGVLFIIGFDSFSINLNNLSNLIPKIAIIVAALGYVISSILAYNLKKVNIIELTTFATISAAVISIPFMLFYEINSPSKFEFNSLIPIIYLGLFPTAIAFIIRFHIISKAGPVFLSYVAYLIPAFAILFGYIILNEEINLSSLIGIILILLGVYFGQMKKLM